MRQGEGPADDSPRSRAAAGSRTRWVGRWIAAVLSWAIGLGSAGAESRPPLEVASAPTRRVVLLHGLGRSARDLALLAYRLEQRGYSVCNVDYDSRVASLDLVAAEVKRAIDACGFEDEPLHFVTHSMGSLVLRVLSREDRVPTGGRAVLLAPPSTGSELADRFGESRWFGLLLGPLAAQLGTQATDLPRQLPPPAIPFGVIAGDRAWNPLGWLWLTGRHDGTVRVDRTRLPEMSDHIVLPHTHTFIAWASDVAHQVDAFLRTGRFERAASSG